MMKKLLLLIPFSVLCLGLMGASPSKEIQPEANTLSVKKRTDTPSPSKRKTPFDLRKEKAAKVFGRIKVVQSGPVDYYVRVLDNPHMADLRVVIDNAHYNSVGRWCFVNGNEDFRICFVGSAEDFDICFVKFGEGI